MFQELITTANFLDADGGANFMKVKLAKLIAGLDRLVNYFIPPGSQPTATPETGHTCFWLAIFWDRSLETSFL